MSNLFYGNRLKDFYEAIQRSVQSQEELVDNVKQAMTFVADELHIGRMLINLSVPQTKLRAQIDNLTEVLYQINGPVDYEPVAFTFRTGDGGTVIISFYAVGDYSFSEEERAELRILSNIVLGVLRVDILERLLRRTMTMDLAVSIPNIAGFMEFANQLFMQGRLDGYTGIYMNIHNFKYVNKVLPNPKADEVMRIYAGMLAHAIDKDECVARLGGDNFVVLLRNENAERFIKFISNMNISYQNDGEMKKFSFSATVGASKMTNIHDVGEMMERISSAYQAARQRGGKNAVYYSENIYREIMQRKEIIAGFHRAISRQEFLVYYQPKVNTKDKTICGGEALVRWKKPDGSMVSPGEFIPILEKEGSICKLDFYVLDKVCEMLGRCMLEQLPLYRISVNFSKRHVENPDLVKEIVAVIDKYNVPHECIEIELTESEDVKDYIVMSELIAKLKAEKVCTSIDDFGTGYSSLNMLKMTDVDLLKIDKSFIPFDNGASDHKKDCVMFESIARLAKELGFGIVAEGVETQQQYEYMYNAGCDMIQGFYFDKPLPEEEYLKRMVAGRY